MNIFYLHGRSKICAKYHCDKHVNKMIIESAQLLSTAHRILDGYVTIEISKKGRLLKRWKLKDKKFDSVLYKSTHYNHPPAKWARESSLNYRWLYLLFTSLLNEYKYRFNKEHGCSKLIDYLYLLPKNIPLGSFTLPPQTMPEKYKIKNNTVDAYRMYYLRDKISILHYTRRQIPHWIIESDLFKQKYPEYYI